MIAYVLFLVLYGVLVSLEDDGRTVRDRLAAVAMHSAAVVTLIALLFVVAFTFWRSRAALPHWNFFTQDLQLTGPLDPLSSGGIVHALAGTLIEIIDRAAHRRAVGVVLCGVPQRDPGGRWPGSCAPWSRR